MSELLYKCRITFQMSMAQMFTKCKHKAQMFSKYKLPRHKCSVNHVTKFLEHRIQAIYLAYYNYIMHIYICVCIYLSQGGSYSAPGNT